jgi:DNA polymerase lambda
MDKAIKKLVNNIRLYNYKVLLKKTNNEIIIENLEKLCQIYHIDTTKKWQEKAITFALKNIKNYKSLIKNGEQAQFEIKGIGKGISNRINEILQTGTLEELIDWNVKELEIIKKLKSIIGVGDNIAKQWIKLGITSIDDVLHEYVEGQIKITHQIQICLKYYNDLLQRIPRNEIDEFKTIFQNIINDIDNKIIFEICGSYRRNLLFCGDIDILITHPIYKTNIELSNILNKIVDNLKQQNIIIEHLTSEKKKKYMGICKIKPASIARRIDIRIVNFYSFYTALLYFTGSKNFNKIIRREALKQGYSLNEYKLTLLKTNHIIILYSEKELFNLLKIKYLSPEERNF